MDACSGNVTDVCKIGQELLMSVRNFSQWAELKELCALVPAQGPMSVQQSEPALAVGNNVSTCPSNMSKVNPELLQCTNHLSTSCETPTKRMKIED